MTIPLRTLLLLAAAAFVSGCTLVAYGDPDGVIAGEVIGALHGPLAGVRVTTDPPTRTIHTDSAGRFLLEGVPRGRYRVTFARDSASVTVDVRARTYLRPIIVRLPIWRLVWSDEFEGSDVDTTVWEIAREGGGHGGVDYQDRFRRSALSVADGRLRITTTPDVDSGWYATASISTRRRFMYGRFEIRAKLPSGQGMWPAHWLWANGDAPEIDIMEALGDDPTRTYATYHYGNWRGARRSNARKHYGPDRSKAFHTYALEWYPTECIWYIDDEEVFRTLLKQPDEPLSLVIDTFVGGRWGGKVDETTVFPQYHDVEYARVYQAVE